MIEGRYASLEVFGNHVLRNVGKPVGQLCRQTLMVNEL